MAITSVLIEGLPYTCTCSGVETVFLVNKQCMHPVTRDTHGLKSNRPFGQIDLVN